MLEIPNLVSKLIEVEYMMQGREMPPDCQQQLFGKFKLEQPAASEKQFKNWLSD